MARPPAKTQPRSDSSAKQSEDAMGVVAAFNGPAMELFTKAYQAYAGGFGALNGEIISFMVKRLERDAELGRALTKSGDLNQMMALQQDWARTTFEEYIAESSKVLEIASGAAQAYWQPFQESASPSSEGDTHTEA